MPESSPNTARSPGAQAADRTYTLAEVRVLMMWAWNAGVMRALGQTYPDLSAVIGGETTYDGRRADVRRVLQEFDVEFPRER